MCLFLRKNMIQAWYETWFDSPYYHLLYQNRTYDEADAFVQKLFTSLLVQEGDKVLDLACGKGRHSISMSKLGADVTGVDLSENSIQSAKSFEGDTLHFFVHDMRRVFRANYFDFVFNFFTSFGYFFTRREQQMVVRSMMYNLKKGGKLLVDFVNKEHAIQNITEKPEERIRIENVDFLIYRTFENDRYVKTIEVNHGTDHFVFKESLRAFSLQDFRSLFEPEGLHLKQTFGNYHLEGFHEKDSPRLIMLWEKD